ncbi:MAG TPA: hypothetical protein VJ011_02850 [Steroidobacteraceae bacterium]|nr:hypothetical protein [Steroidobacteraceae bacterium]
MFPFKRPFAAPLAALATTSVLLLLDLLVRTASAAASGGVA